MKILYLSQLIPYPVDAGPKVRSYYVLRYLAEAGHDVTLVAFRRDNDEIDNIEHLKQFCSAVHTVLMQRSRVKDVLSLAYSQLSGTPFLIQRDHVPAMHDLLKNLLAQHDYDAIHADQLWMAQYALMPKAQAGKHKSPCTVLDQHNAVFLIPQRLATETRNPLKRAILSLESRRLARYEVAVCNQFDHVVWVTGEDCQSINSLATNDDKDSRRSNIIPICVEPIPTSTHPTKRPKTRITFLGGLHWPPNAQGILWFAKEIFPLVQAEIPEAVVTVIGKNPPSELVGEQIEVTGYVADLTPLLAETAVFIVPLLAGGGMRVKILDAWNWNLPIVSTTVGAEGIAVEDEKNMLIADTPEAFAQATIRILQNPDLAERLAQNGRQTLLTQYNWRTIYRAWDKIYTHA